MVKNGGPRHSSTLGSVWSYSSINNDPPHGVCKAALLFGVDQIRLSGPLPNRPNILNRAILDTADSRTLTRTHRLFPHLGTAISPPDGRSLARGRVCLREGETEADAAPSRSGQVEERQRGGEDIRKSADLLELFDEKLATHISERDRLVAELAERF